MGKATVIKQVEKIATKNAQQAENVVADIQKKAGKTVKVDDLPQNGAAKIASKQSGKVEGKEVSIEGEAKWWQKVDNWAAEQIEDSSHSILRNRVKIRENAPVGAEKRISIPAKVIGAPVALTGASTAIGGLGSVIIGENALDGMAGGFNVATNILSVPANVVLKGYRHLGDEDSEDIAVSTKETGKSSTGYGWLDTLIDNCNGLTAAGAVAAIGGVASNQPWLTALGVTMAVGSWVMNYTGAFETDDDTSSGSDGGDDEKEAPEATPDPSETKSDTVVASDNTFSGNEKAEEDSGVSTVEQVEKDLAFEGAIAATKLRDMGDEVVDVDTGTAADGSAAEKQAQYDNYEPEL